jgi:hypothetical protein
VSTPNPERLDPSGGETPEADALLAYVGRMGGKAGYTYDARALEDLCARYGARVLRLVVDVAADLPERQQRADVLFGRLLPRMLQRVQRLGIVLGRDYGLEQDYGRRW